MVRSNKLYLVNRYHAFNTDKYHAYIFKHAKKITIFSNACLYNFYYMFLSQ